MAKRKSASPQEKWIGEHLVEAGFSPYHAAHHRKVIDADPEYAAIWKKYEGAAYKASRAFHERYGSAMSFYRGATEGPVTAYRKSLEKSDPKAAKRFDRMLSAIDKPVQKSSAEQVRFIQHYAKTHPEGMAKAKAKAKTKAKTKSKSKSKPRARGKGRAKAANTAELKGRLTTLA